MNSIVKHIFAIDGKADKFHVERIKNNTKIPLSWVKEIPVSKREGVAKLQDEREILILQNRSSDFIQKFEHIPEGAKCYHFYKFTPYSNCNYWCEYCYLYLTFKFRPQSIHYVNYDKIYKEIDRLVFARKGKSMVLLNCGELADPLAIDDITGFSKEIIPFVAEREGVKLLLLSKSDKIENVLGLEHKGRIILSWSINCNYIAKLFEHKAPSPLKRVLAAQKAQKEGYEIRFRFDPLFEFPGWKKQYKNMVEMVFELTKPTMITLGEYRPSRSLIGQIKKRFSGSELVAIDKTLIFEGGKKRYPEKVRNELYSFVINEIRKLSKKVNIALCKETENAWMGTGLNCNGFKCNCLI